MEENFFARNCCLSHVFCSLKKRIERKRPCLTREDAPYRSDLHEMRINVGAERSILSLHLILLVLVIWSVCDGVVFFIVKKRRGAFSEEKIKRNKKTRLFTKSHPRPRLFFAPFSLTRYLELFF